MTTARTLLLIGGTGFFGKSFLDAFARGLLAPWGITRVIAAARRPGSLAKTCPELVGPGVELHALDAATAPALPHADVVIHAANTTDAQRYAADPAGERAAILAAADHFADIARSDLAGARIVYTSSGAVYGQQPADLPGLPEDAPFADAAGLVAYKRDYAEAKRLAEGVIARLGAAHGINVAVARCFAFVGPYLPRDQHFAIGNFIGDGLADRPIEVKAQRPVVRSYMHADDLVRWLMTIADAASPACPVYNVGSDQAVEMLELARLVAARFGVPVRSADRAPAPVDRYVPSTARAARDLGLRLEHDLVRAVETTIQMLEPSHRLRIAS